MRRNEEMAKFYFTDTGYFFLAGNRKEAMKQKKPIHGRFIIEARVENPAGFLDELWMEKMNMNKYLYLLWEEDIYSPNVEFLEYEEDI